MSSIFCTSCILSFYGGSPPTITTNNIVVVERSIDLSLSIHRYNPASHRTIHNLNLKATHKTQTQKRDAKEVQTEEGGTRIRDTWWQFWTDNVCGKGTLYWTRETSYSENRRRIRKKNRLSTLRPILRFNSKFITMGGMLHGMSGWHNLDCYRLIMRMRKRRKRWIFCSRKIWIVRKKEKSKKRRRVEEKRRVNERKEDRTQWERTE